MDAPARVFLCYRRQDSGDIARELYNALRRHLAGDIFMDIESIAPGERFPRALEQALSSSHVVLALIGPNWVTDRLFVADDFVRRELAAAFSHDIRVIPVLVDGGHMPEARALPDELAPLSSLQAVELPSAQRVRELVQTIQQWISGREVATENGGSQLAADVAEYRAAAQEAIDNEELCALQQKGNEPHFVIQECHYCDVTAAAFGTDGRLLAAGYADGTSRLWDTPAESLLAVHSGHTREVTAIAFSPDGSRIATGALDCTIRILECPGGRLLQVLSFDKHDDGNQAYLAFSPDGATLLAAGTNLQLWNAATGHLLFSVNDIRCAAFSPDCDTLAVVDGDSVRLLDARTGGPRRAVQVRERPWRRPGFPPHVPLDWATFAPDGTEVITAGRLTKAIWFWDVATLTRTRAIDGGPRADRKCALNPDTIRVAIPSEGSLEIWDIRSCRLLGICSVVKHPTCSPDRKFVAGASARDSIDIYDSNGALVHTLGMPYKYDPCGKSGRAHTSAIIAPDRNTIITGVENVGGERNQRCIWNAQTRARTGTLEWRHFEYIGDFDAVHFNADSNTALLGLLGMYVVVDLKSGTGRSLPLRGGAGNLAVSADGGLIGRIVEEVVEIYSAWKCPSIRQVSADRGEPLVQRIQPRQGYPKSIAFRRTDGIVAIGCSNGVIELRDPETGDELGELSGVGSEMLAVDFRCDGKALASGDAAGRVLLWDTAACRLVGQMGTHTNACVEVRYSPYGGLLVSRAADEDFVNVWDSPTGTLVRSIGGLSGAVGMHWSADGYALAVFRQVNAKKDHVTTVVALDAIRPAIVLRAFEDGEWVAVDENGRFTSSEYPTEKIGWRVGERLFRTRSLSDRYFVPGLFRCGAP